MGGIQVRIVSSKADEGVEGVEDELAVDQVEVEHLLRTDTMTQEEKRREERRRARNTSTSRMR